MYQKLIIVGNLGRDPEMRFTASGTPVTNLSVATNRKWNNAEGVPQEETVWFRVSAWGRLAETCNQYLTKGRQVLIEGSLKPDETGNPRVWVGQDGVPHASFEMTAATVKFLGGRGSGDSQDSAEPPQRESEDDIPF